MKRERISNRLVLAWRVLAITLVVTVAVLITSAVGHAGTWAGKVSTGANGAKTVTSPAKGFSESATIKLPELWRLGGDSEDEEEFFGVISDIDIDATGQVYLLDSQLNEAKIYTKDGEFVRSIGREGEGPGEFRMPSSMFFTKDDKVAVIQMMPGKIVQLTKDGQPSGEHAIPQAPDGGFQLIQGGDSRGGNIVLYMARQQFDQANNKWSRASFLTSIDPTGKQLAEYSKKENVISMASAEMNDASWDTFERRWEVGPDGKVYACNSFDNYEITVYDKTGKIDKVITREYKHVARTADEKDFMNRMFSHWAKMIPNCKVVINDMNKDIDSIYLRDDGSLWVLSSAGARNLAQGTLGTFDVFNPEGQFVKQVTLQGQGNPLEDLYVFEKDRLYVVTSFLQAAMSAQGVQGLYDEADEPEPMAVICYKLEGDVLAAR
ncbi:MAG TPA: 6-bladed beta-propeller [Candidatus Krumholzibacteria bacterium]|nr:6-bladed beta-propeller [Candidatus Krumholzibacteria bacterium]